MGVGEDRKGLIGFIGLIRSIGFSCCRSLTNPTNSTNITNLTELLYVNDLASLR